MPDIFDEVAQGATPAQDFDPVAAGATPVDIFEVEGEESDDQDAASPAAGASPEDLFLPAAPTLPAAATMIVSLEDPFAELLWKRGYVQDADGWPVTIRSQAEARVVAKYLLRSWLSTEFRRTRLGDRVMQFYLRFGERVAALARRSRLLRWALRPFFELALFFAVRDLRDLTSVRRAGV